MSCEFFSFVEKLKTTEGTFILAVKSRPAVGPTPPLCPPCPSPHPSSPPPRPSSPPPSPPPYPSSLPPSPSPRPSSPSPHPSSPPPCSPSPLLSPLSFELPHSLSLPCEFTSSPSPSQVHCTLNPHSLCVP